MCHRLTFAFVRSGDRTCHDFAGREAAGNAHRKALFLLSLRSDKGDLALVLSILCTTT